MCKLGKETRDDEYKLLAEPSNEECERLRQTYLRYKKAIVAADKLAAPALAEAWAISEQSSHCKSSNRA